MDRLTLPQRKTAFQGFLSLVLIVIGIKLTLNLLTMDRKPLPLEGEPVLLFFNVDESCECMKELVQDADQQIQHWTEEARSHITLQRINFDERPDLVEQYEVFRYPCLILLDASGQIVYRQDYPLIEGGPLDLFDFEEQIKVIVGQE